jgi:ankyrin repeat protein
MCTYILLDNGADLYAKDVDGRTALHYAVMSSCEGCTSLLLDYARVKGEDGGKQTAKGFAR